MLFARILRSFVTHGSLRLVSASGRSYDIGNGAGPRLIVRVTTKRAERALCLNPALAIGESYMDGGLVIEQGALIDFLSLLARSYGTSGNNVWLAALERVTRGLKQYNPMGVARRNVAHHYDLSSELYDLFLDSDRQYSCAYFRDVDDSLETAQAAKRRHIGAKLKLDRPGLKILDIGSGWGGMALELARMADAHVTGVTLSEEQHRMSVERAQRAGLANRVHFHLRDYREQTGPFDRIVSVGMFEHVGKRNYPEFFRKLHGLLADDGVALLHTIGYTDAPGPINPFIRKHIFPGADLPALSEILTVVERTGLIVTDVEVLRLHYAETLKHWRERFLAKRERAAQLYDERFCRMWEFYLALCEVGFRYRTTVVFQIQLTRRLDALPFTRDYMVDAERAAGSVVAEPTLARAIG